jgi:hypothetical protein
MASIRNEISTKARPDDAWAALRDVGALHTRLVPGFVTGTRLEPGARIVTFGNGMVVRELIVTIDEHARRVVWSAVGGRRVAVASQRVRAGRRERDRSDQNRLDRRPPPGRGRKRRWRHDGPGHGGDEADLGSSRGDR